MEQCAINLSQHAKVFNSFFVTIFMLKLTRNQSERRGTGKQSVVAVLSSRQLRQSLAEKVLKRQPRHFPFETASADGVGCQLNDSSLEQIGKFRPHFLFLHKMQSLSHSVSQPLKRLLLAEIIVGG